MIVDLGLRRGRQRTWVKCPRLQAGGVSHLKAKLPPYVLSPPPLPGASFAETGPGCRISHSSAKKNSSFPQASQQNSQCETEALSIAQGHPPSLCPSPVCFLGLKGAFCLVCQGLLEPESFLGCGCFVPAPLWGLSNAWER